jgi:signal transduction histidine kinase
MAVGLDKEEIKGVVLPIDPEDSVAARSVIEKKPFVIPDAQQDPRVNSTLKKRFNLHSLIVIPLLAKEKVMGIIAADHIEPGKSLTQETVESMMTFAQQAGLAIQNAFMYQELKTFSQQMEEKIQKTTADLKKTEAQLIRSEKLASLGELAAGIAHEIRNPLTSINILIHSMAESLSSENIRREDLRVIEEEIERINEIIDQFLKFGKPSPPLFEKTHVVSILEETLQLLRLQIEKQKIHVEREYQLLPAVVLDREQMKQVILNLVMNALQAMPEGGRLWLSVQTSAEGRWIQIGIRDSGTGIPPKNMDRLFDPFFSTREGGIGLGLPIAHRIIDQHHGRIEVASTPQGGTLFALYLPVEQEEKDANHPDC